MNHRKQVQGLSALALTSLLLLLAVRWLHLESPGITMGVLLWAAGESLISFYGLSWGLNKSSTTFFTIFAGGALVRLISLGIVALIVSVLHVPPATPLLSLVAAYFVLSIVQLPFFNYELR
jgi:hypothetical protein